MSQQRTVFDFSYLCDRIAKFVATVRAIEGGGPDPDDVVELAYKARDEAVWRILPLAVLMPPSADLPPGEYRATLFDVDPANPEARKAIREILAELRPTQAEEGNAGAAVYVRACGAAFEQLKSSSSFVSSELERLAARLRESDDDRDRMRRELDEARAYIHELERKIDENGNEPGALELIQMAYSVIKGDTASSTDAQTSAEPTHQIPANAGPPAPAPEEPKP